jgi:hypothetical protein
VIDGLKPYPEYKESGQAWLGAVPFALCPLPSVISHLSSALCHLRFALCPILSAVFVDRPKIQGYFSQYLGGFFHL